MWDIIMIIYIYTLIKRRNYVNIFYCAARTPDIVHNNKHLHEKMCFPSTKDTIQSICSHTNM